MNLRERLARDLFTYAGATYFVQILGVLTSFAMRYFLGPKEMGYWSILDLVLTYSLYAQFGAMTAIYTEIPYYIGKKDETIVESIRNTSFAFIGGMSILTGFCLCLTPFFLPSKTPMAIKAGLPAMAVILTATNWYNFNTSMMWAYKRFTLLSQGIVINALLYLLLILLLTPFLHFWGLLATVLCATLITAWFTGSRLDLKLRFKLDKNTLLLLLRAGFPLFLGGFVYSFYLTMDRLLIAKFLGVIPLGHYSIAILAMTYANAVPKLLSTVLFPSMQERYGETSNNDDLRKFIVRPIELLCCVMPLFLGFAYLLAPPLVTMILPKYIPGIESMRLLLIGVFFIALAQPLQNLLTTLNKRLQLIPITLFGIGSAFVLALFFLQHQKMLESIALAMAAGFAVYYSVLFFYGFRFIHDARETKIVYGWSVVSFSYLLVILMLLDKIFGAGRDISTALVKFTIFFVLMVPLLFYANRKFQLIKTFRDMTFARQRDAEVVKK